MKVVAVVSTKGGPGNDHGWRQFRCVLRRCRCSDLVLPIHSSDPFNQLGNLLLHAADGCLRLKNLLLAFEQDLI